MYEELIKALRDEAEYADLVAYMHGIKSISHGDATAEVAGSWAQLFHKAADAIEELANKLCDWCGVCPKERRRPWDCEIMWPNAPIPEVYIEPPKEET